MTQDPHQTATVSAKSADILLTGTDQHHRGIAAVGKLYHAINSSGFETRAWYSRVTCSDKRHVLSLGLDHTLAAKLDREARQMLRKEISIGNVKTWIAAELAGAAISPPSPPAPAGQLPQIAPQKVTIREIVCAHEAAYFDALPRTTLRYRASFLNLVETALRHRTGQAPLKRSGKRMKASDYSVILDTPLEAVDEIMVADFKAARLANYDRKSLQELSRKRSTNTELRQARCLLGEDAQLAYKQAGLKLPDLSGFLSAPRFRKVTCKPKLPSDTTLDTFFSGLGALKQSDPAVFDVVGMALYPGMRRTEILHANQSWLQSSCGPALRIEFGLGFRPKNCTERTIPIPQWFFDHLKHPTVGAYLTLKGAGDRSRILERAVHWLRGHGWSNAPKPLHSLRALYAAYLLATETNPVRIKSRLGHADLTTTFRYYADEPLSEHYCSVFQAPVV